MGTQVRRFVARHRLRLCEWSAGAIAALLIASGCGPKPTDWHPPDIVLISIDTLRADHLPTYGYPRPIAPQIDALADRSAVFDRAYSHAPRTLPAHTSLLTGLVPARHGVLTRGDRLGPDETTLAELLRAQGYSTGAFVNAYFVSPEFGLDRGFDVYDFKSDKLERSAEESNEVALDWIDSRAEAPFLLFVHYFDAHSDRERLPYDSPEPYFSQFAGEAPRNYRPGRGQHFASRHLARMNQLGQQLPEASRRYVEHLYDAGIAYVDDQVGNLLSGLEERGRLENAIVILTSDHGEEFQEHGKLMHSQVYEELVRVPLLVSFPEMRGARVPTCRPGGTGSEPGVPAAGRVGALVQHVDLLPTLIECLGLEPPETGQGASFLHSLNGGPGSREIAYFETFDGRQLAVLREGWKLIRSKDRNRLYHLPSDPGEKSDVAREHPDRVAALSALLDRYRNENSIARTSSRRLELDPAIDEALEALGYAEAKAQP